MDSLIVYHDAACTVGERIAVADGFVSRCVSAIAAENIPDAKRAAAILNAAVAAKNAPVYAIAAE